MMKKLLQFDWKPRLSWQQIIWCQRRSWTSQYIWNCQISRSLTYIWFAQFMQYIPRRAQSSCVDAVSVFPHVKAVCHLFLQSSLSVFSGASTGSHSSLGKSFLLCLLKTDISNISFYLSMCTPSIHPNASMSLQGFFYIIIVVIAFGLSCVGRYLWDNSLLCLSSSVLGDKHRLMLLALENTG